MVKNRTKVIKRQTSKEWIEFITLVVVAVTVTMGTEI